MIVYLAELCHTGKGRSPNTVPLAAGLLAATVGKRFPEATVCIYRDPEELLGAVRDTPPDVVGFSVYSWSERLSSFCARRVKEIAPATVTVAGGASIDDVDAEIERYLREHPGYDVLVPGQGEPALVALVEHLAAHGTLSRREQIAGCALAAPDGSLLRGPDVAPDLEEIPSPYLGGLLDRFLDEGYDPVIQSMRGCPYRCTFCVSGTSLWNAMVPFPLERVFEELAYVRTRARGDYLLLTDENLGVLKERDVRLAEEIIRSHREHGFPARLYFYTAKIVTRHVLKVIEALSPITDFGMSFQTLNPDVKKAIQRTNVSWEKFVEYVQWAKVRGIKTSTEMIFGFPGETVESYLEGLERLLRSGVDSIYSYNLRLLSGTDLATAEDRERHRYETRFRLQERTYGRYDGEVVAELEEVVVGSESFDYSGYRRIRRYGLFLELCSGLGYFSELMQLMRRSGLAGEKLVHHLAGHAFRDFPALRAIVEEYDRRIDDELFATPEECTEHVRGLLARGEPVPEVKLNFIFSGRMVLDEHARGELFEAVRQFLVEQSPDETCLALLEDYLENVAARQIVSFRAGEETVVRAHSRIRLDRLPGDPLEPLKALFAERAAGIELALPPEAAAFIERSPLAGVGDEAAVQDVYMNVPRSSLTRTRSAAGTGTRP